MTDAASLPYRPCVGVMLINKAGLVWVGRRFDKQNDEGKGHWWQMPQGGIDEGEKPRAAALRELWEETGLILGRKAPWPDTPPAAWCDFAAAGYVPSAENLQFVFRAITPPGRPRRFDARFFAIDASHLAGAFLWWYAQYR